VRAVPVLVSRTAITFRGSRRGFAGAKPTRRGLDQLDEEVAGWVREAYHLGQGGHLR
jgi:hypothetical protein